MTKEEILSEIGVEEKRLDALTARAMDYDPFWYWKPNDGILSDDGREVLARYLKPEDIPHKVNGQLDRLLSKAAINGTSGGNQSGKTDVETIDGIIKATGELPDSLREYEKHFEDVLSRARSKIVRGRVTAVDNKQLHRVVLNAWQKYTPKQYLKGGDWDKSYSKEFDILTLYRNKKPCATVEYLTNEQAVKSAQGNPLDWAKFDEEPASDKWKETLMRFIATGKPDIGIAWTPTEGLTWATDLFHGGVDIDGDKHENSAELFKLTPVCNPYVKKETLIEIFDEFAKVSSYDEMRMRLLGDAVSLSGLVYGGLFDYRFHVIPPFSTKCNCGNYKLEQTSGHSDNCPVNKFFVRVGLDPHLVTPTAGVFVGSDKVGNYYVFNSYFPARAEDTEQIKDNIHKIANDGNYRWGQTIIDKSSNSDIEVLGGLNIFKELSQGKKALRGVKTSEKHEGSIKAGVDEIKKLLKENPVTKKPRFFIFDIPENKPLIQSFKTLERDTYKNEDKKGVKDRIAEGKHHLHAALRYCFQYRFNWIPNIQSAPELSQERYI